MSRDRIRVVEEMATGLLRVRERFPLQRMVDRTQGPYGALLVRRGNGGGP